MFGKYKCFSICLPFFLLGLINTFEINVKEITPLLLCTNSAKLLAELFTMVECHFHNEATSEQAKLASVLCEQSTAYR